MPDTPGTPGRPGATATKLSDTWAALRQDTDLRGRRWSEAASDAADEWLAQVFASADQQDNQAPAGTAGPASRSARLGGLLSRRPPAPAGGAAALLAVGSLGRRDVAPGSDLDLLLVHRGRADIDSLADRLWYPIWDDPMPLDHSVRTLAQAAQAAESDLRVALGLLDARLVAGDAELYAELVALTKSLWQKRAAKWLPGLADSRSSAHEGLGDVAFLLEPELQEGRGGLRDLQVLTLLGKVTPVVAPVLAEPGLRESGDFLHAVRVELQRPTGKRSERLLLEDQDKVAEALGLAGRPELAHQVATAARTVAWLMDDAWRRVGSWLAGPRGRGGSADRPLGPGLVLRDNEVVVPAQTAIGADPTLALRAAAASAELGMPLARATMARLKAEAPVPSSPWPEPVLRAFLELLAAGYAAVGAVETLDHLGVWQRYMPEWDLVRNRPQFNPYHRWTVDRHLLEAVAAAAEHQRDVHRPDLLLIGMLLHDIGKGQPGDHSRAGADLAVAALERMGLAREDRTIVHKLVLHHLLLPDVATRRDLEDPATATAVADTVGDLVTLELLGAMADADGRATGPAAWTPWKARLVEDLVRKAQAVLEGRPVPVGPAFPNEDQRALMAAGGTQVVPGAHDVTVVAPDRPGLFADLTGALALHGISILSARACSEEGKALDLFVLDVDDEAPPRWERVVADLAAAANKQLDVAEALARRPGPPRALRRAAALAVAGTRVIVDNDAGTSATIVEVRAPDSPGLLHRVGRALASLGLDIVSAQVSTLGAAAVDTFYVRSEGEKLAGESQADTLRQSLEALLAAPTGA
ncbi:MAG TPA: [protein-PII] uridylyltransferase [Acidimicrobiales bacterium]|nr:[protein-PII] uridylyltransferase [Acidimicrobiales bacterium]